MADTDMADAPADMATSSQQQAQSHPDAQATVTDFLDYTEFYPSDLIRSMTLIEKLDKLYQESAARVHELTKLYGKLPTLPTAERPDPTTLRRQISEALNEAERARESSFAEAARLYENTERHATRLVTIKKKLQALPEPPSRDPTPAPAPSPQMARTRKQESDRTPRIMLHMDAPRARPTSTARVQKHRERKRKRAQQAALGVMPGQIFDQGEAGSPPPSNASDSDEERSVSPSEARLNQIDAASGEIITDKAGIKQPKIKGPKFKGPKPPPRAPRPPGMGTNVHSQIAGISTSNALAQLTPPPPDARPGTRHAPWHKLTDYEMAVLRKTMKKNAIWQPSDTMIRRELSSKGRGWENYKKAKEHSERTGEPFIDELPMDPNKEVLDPGETSFKPLGKEDSNLINRGMKLNEMKKLKREATLREQAARDAMEIEDASRRVADAGAVIKNLFDGPAPTPIAVSKDKARPPRKRKRDSTPDASKVNGKEDAAPPPESAPRPTGPKKLKLAPPAPPKSNENTAATSPVAAQPEMSPEAPKVSTSQVPLAQPGPTSRAPSVASARSRTPALPSPIDQNPPSSQPPNPPPNATAAASRSRRASTAPQAVAPQPGESAAPPPTELHRAMSPAVPTHTTQTLPRTRTGTSAKAASEEAPVKRELRELRDTRRASNVSLPAPAEHQATAPVATSAPQGTRSSGRRSKRPAPGLINAEGGKNKVAVGKRTAAPKKKGSKKAEEKNDGAQGANQHGDDWAEDIDPNEERYCICGDVSYGMMIACENEENCEKEWFHLPCVGLAEIPKRREKWYCPDCRSMLKIDEKGNPVETGGRR
ncbi:hypothetical protein IWZ00DRAFT_494763 [Phyllosticta capitalensis]|uniref:Chromatin modification-related protein n=1 Tax=Phyllosticta capitalensis TaxID=121624 RepID=A0ABR1Z2H6_9PEZI